MPMLSGQSYHHICFANVEQFVRTGCQNMKTRGKSAGVPKPEKKGKTSKRDSSMPRMVHVSLGKRLQK